MSEGPPKLPTRESLERPPKFETVSLEVLKVWRDKDGDLVQRGCHTESNGIETRVTYEDVTYDSDGSILYVSAVDIANATD